MLVNLLDFTLLAWCGFSQQFLPEFDKLSRTLHRMGESDIIFVKIDGDKDQYLSMRYGIEGFPTIFIQE